MVLPRLAVATDPSRGQARGVMTLPYSGALFCCVFARECTEAFLEGHRRAFEFFGGVPYEAAQQIVTEVSGGRRDVLEALSCSRRGRQALVSDSWNGW